VRPAAPDRRHLVVEPPAAGNPIHSRSAMNRAHAIRKGIRGDIRRSFKRVEGIALIPSWFKLLPDS
jgi:hypothetical protein